MSIMASFSLVLEGGSVDGDTPCFFFGSLVDAGVLNVFRFLFVGEILGDG